MGRGGFGIRGEEISFPPSSTSAAGNAEVAELCLRSYIGTGRNPPVYLLSLRM